MTTLDKEQNEFDIIFKVSQNVTLEVAYTKKHSVRGARYLSFSATVFSKNHKSVKNVFASNLEKVLVCNRVKTNGKWVRATPLVDKDGAMLDDFFSRFYDEWKGNTLRKLTDKQVRRLVSEIEQLKNTGLPFVEADTSADLDTFHAVAQKVVLLKPHTATRIKWDTDGATYKELGLPTSVVVPFGMDEDEVSDWLSDTFEFCHDSFYTNFSTEE